MDYDTLGLEELENKLAELIKDQKAAYSDFIYWSCQSSIDKVKKAIEDIKKD